MGGTALVGRRAPDRRLFVVVAIRLGFRFVTPGIRLGAGDDPGDIGVFAPTGLWIHRLTGLGLLPPGGLVLLLLLAGPLAGAFVLGGPGLLHGVIVNDHPGLRASRWHDIVARVAKLHAKGSRVSQPSYGPGTVSSSDERYTVIEFDNHGRRVFVTDMVTLEKTDEPAPNRPVKEKRRKAPAKKAEKAEKGA